MALIVFLHANSFGASTYGVMLDALRTRGYSVCAPEKLGHDPRWPVSSNWPNLVQQVADFAQTQAQHHDGPVWLVGHSLGGFLSLMTACYHPELAAGVVMLDSPIVGGWRAKGLALAKHTGLMRSLSPGAVSQKRRNRWDSLEAAHTHFRSKKVFAAWDPQVLRDYVEHGTHEQQGQRVLSFDRDVETAIYNALPHNLDRMLRLHPPRCPVAYIGGEHSTEMAQVGLQRTRRLVQQRLTLLRGSHLFPMELPLPTAEAIDEAIQSMAKRPAP